MKRRMWMVTGAALVLTLGGASLAREREAGDDHGGRGGHHAVAAKDDRGQHPEPGDDRGGHGHDDGRGHH